MATAEHIQVVLQGAKAIREWHESHSDKRFDLAGAKLDGVDLEDANLAGSNLDGASLVGTNLSWSNLTWSEVREADLTGATLDESRLMETYFTRSIIRNARLIGVDAYWADVGGVDFTKSNFEGARWQSGTFADANLESVRCSNTIFAGCDLSQCLGLGSVSHDGPSFVDFHTLVRTLDGNASGKYTDEQMVFFSSAGIPRTMLEYLPGIIEENPIQFYSCFISFSSANNVFTAKLYDDLTAKGVSCWKYDESAVWGRSTWGNIDRAIKHYDKLIVICSEESLNSRAVLREISRALEKEAARTKAGARDTDVLFPITIDNYLYDEWEHEYKADVLEKVVGDFRVTERYDENVERLVAALQPKTWFNPLTP